MNSSAGGAITWRTSSYSTTNGDCVEVGWTVPGVLVRDSKDHSGGVLALTGPEWRMLLARTPSRPLDGQR